MVGDIRAQGRHAFGRQAGRAASPKSATLIWRVRKPRITTERKAALAIVSMRRLHGLLHAAGSETASTFGDLAERCRPRSKSLICHYYQSKEDILFDVMIRPCMRALDRSGRRGSAAGADDATENCARSHCTFMALLCEAAGQHKVLLNEAPTISTARGVPKIVKTQREAIPKQCTLLVEIRPKVKRNGEVWRQRCCSSA